MYSHSLRNLLTVQLDAAINPGNSGGPVFYGSKIAGIAFQGHRKGENLGYMIPCEVIRHFLKDIEDGRVDGCGLMGFSYARWKIRVCALTTNVPGTDWNAGYRGESANGKILAGRN